MTAPNPQLQALFCPGKEARSGGLFAFWGTDDLGEATRALAIPHGATVLLSTVVPRTPRARTRVKVDLVESTVVPIMDATRALATLAAPHEWPAWRRPSDSIMAWSAAAKLALELVAAGRLAPGLRRDGAGGWVAGWRAALVDEPRIDQLAACMPPAAHALVRDDDDEVWSARGLLIAFCDAVADACVRASRGQPITPRPPSRQSVGRRWIEALTGPEPMMVNAPPHTVLAPDLGDRVTAWSSSVTGVGHASARLCVQLHTPDSSDSLSSNGEWSLAYLLQAADDPTLVVLADEVWSRGASSMALLGRRVDNPQETLVRGLAEASRLFPPLMASLAESRPVGLVMGAEHAADFLARAGDLAAAGLGVMLPRELTATGTRRMRVRMRVGAEPDPGAGLTPQGLDEAALAAFSWEIAMGDDVITEEEFRQIVALKEPLVRWRGRWVRVDPEEALTLAELTGEGGRLAPAAALNAGLTGEITQSGLGTVEVVAGGALADLLRTLGDHGHDVVARLDGIQATLRDYQHRGVAWLQHMAALGLGVVLADDMGLGKTLQTIALLADRGTERPHLVVCPTSVVSNWERELQRFAPHLQTIGHYGPDRAGSAGGFAPGAVVLTSYGLLRRDADLLQNVDWDTVVLDEAQQIKNPAAQASRIARNLPSRQRIALTGTPVENRLSELWAIMEFANPGLLGSFAGFRDTFAIPVERWGDEDAAARLRRLVAPFVLRRTKADPAVAVDLPEKQELTVSCALTKEQATLYQAEVDKALVTDLGDGIDRRGRILALLTALKQICNHPLQYLGESGRLPGRSGKLARATELLAEITAAGDRALVFTQYRRMGELLIEHWESALDLPELPFLHGGVSRAGRDRMVDAFQKDENAPPVLVVSLKAGGTGLNLTRATHVLHYDRWWNPAVEDQATDRAYRIGQTRMVTAHKLVTVGTLEERIAMVLEQKRALAEAVVGAGETWLTELSDDELRDLVALSAGNVEEEAA